MSIILGNKKLTIEKLIQVARLKKKVELHPDAIERINNCRQLLEEKIQTRKTLVAGLATNKQARDRFYNLFDELEHIPARESTLAAARELLSPNEEAARQQRRATLLRNLAQLSPEEREELRTLSAGTLNPKAES